MRVHGPVMLGQSSGGHSRQGAPIGGAPNAKINLPYGRRVIHLGEARSGRHGVDAPAGSTDPDQPGSINSVSARHSPGPTATGLATRGARKISMSASRGSALITSLGTPSSRTSMTRSTYGL